MPDPRKGNLAALPAADIAFTSIRRLTMHFHGILRRDNSSKPTPWLWNPVEGGDLP
jgi:hypothetical protein